MSTLIPTPYPVLNALLLEFLSSTKAILTENFVGAYLQGSLATGDFDEHSDIDFLVVTRKELSASEVSALQDMHMRIYGLGGIYRPDCLVRTRILAADHWETSLEGSYFPQNILKQSELVNCPQWYLDNGGTLLERHNHDDTLVMRWTVRECGIVLAGPEPRTLIDPISADDLRHEVLAKMDSIATGILDGFWNNRWGQSYAILFFCRMLQTLETGRIHSKRAGVIWGQEKLDRRWASVIEQAWNLRGHGHVSEPADEKDFKNTVAFSRYAMEESRKYIVASPDDAHWAATAELP